MTVRIDKAGRIVVPKSIRERFHLDAGADLELEERPEGLVLRPAERRQSLVQREGIWVHLGKAARNLDWGRMVEDEREERIREIAKL